MGGFALHSTPSRLLPLETKWTVRVDSLTALSTITKPRTLPRLALLELPFTLGSSLAKLWFHCLGKGGNTDQGVEKLQPISHPLWPARSPPQNTLRLRPGESAHSQHSKLSVNFQSDHDQAGAEAGVNWDNWYFRFQVRLQRVLGSDRLVFVSQTDSVSSLFKYAVQKPYIVARSWATRREYATDWTDYSDIFNNQVSGLWRLICQLPSATIIKNSNFLTKVVLRYNGIWLYLKPRITSSTHFSSL